MPIRNMITRFNGFDCLLVVAVRVVVRHTPRTLFKHFNSSFILLTEGGENNTILCRVLLKLKMNPSLIVRILNDYILALEFIRDKYFNDIAKNVGTYLYRDQPSEITGFIYCYFQLTLYHRNECKIQDVYLPTTVQCHCMGVKTCAKCDDDDQRIPQ